MSGGADNDLAAMLVEWRRDFHRYPEVSGQEERTSAKIKDFLTSLGFAVQTFPGHHGLCAVVAGRLPGPTVAVRADMDALSVTEETGREYSSTVPGVMHACGHDAHMAIALGTAKLLAESRDRLAGAVKLIFQPAEEAAPLGGASRMIADGALRDPDVAAIFAVHMWPDLPCGHVGLRKGPMAAASDRMNIRVFGDGAHAAEPHKGTDAIAIATAVYQGLNQVMNRQVDPREIATISVGRITGGERYNVIAREVLMEGTVRTLGEGVRREIPRLVDRMVAGVAAAFGGAYALDYQFGYPVLMNDAAAYDAVLEAARRVAGEGAVHGDMAPILGADDFAFYAGVVPGAYFFLGCRGEGATYPLHSSRFDIDERALLVGTKVMYETVLAALAQGGRRQCS